MVVEAPLTRLEIEGKSFLGNAVEVTHMPLRLVPEILDPVDMVAVLCKQLGMIDPKMLESRGIENIIGLPAVRIDNAVRHHIALDDRVQSG